MNGSTKRKAALFVDRSSRHWVVQDPEGVFWILPSVENPWDHREPFNATTETELDPVPGHYRDLLQLPF